MGSCWNAVSVNCTGDITIVGPKDSSKVLTKASNIGNRDVIYFS